MESSKLLRGVPLLLSLADSEIARLTRDAVSLSLPAGETILTQGDVGDRMYVIESGAVQVWTRAFDGSDIVLARLEPGEYFGEQALLPGGDGRRNASIRTLQPTRLLSISRDSLLGVLEHDAGLLKQFRDVAAERDAFRAENFRKSMFGALHVDAAPGNYQVVTFRAGEVVFSEGEAASAAYLVVRGRVLIERYVQGARQSLSEILPGQFFGEVAILNNSPRSASAMALEDVELAALDAAWFRAARQAPALRSRLESLSSMYLLPWRGLLTLQNGTFEGYPCVTAVHNLTDGRRVVSTRPAGTTAFHSEALGLSGEPEIVTFQNASLGIARELHILDGRLAALHSVGEWPALGGMLELLLDGTPLLPWQVEIFRQRGEIQAAAQPPLYEKNEILCTCTKTTFGQVRGAIAQNCCTLEAVAKKTGATMVCGGCVPLVKELLGRSDWAPARIAGSRSLAPGIQAFRIAPVEGDCKPWFPGQHLVIQARVKDRTIQRAYTLSSAPGDNGAYEITVKREPRGVFSSWLFAGPEPGALLRISQPGGNYYLPDDRAGDVVCFAGGIGITPALSMLRTIERLRTIQGTRAIEGRARRLRLHVDYSVRHESEAVCRDEFAAAAERNPRIAFTLRVTGRDGRIEREHVATIAARHPEALYFLCGSAPYMDAIQGHLLAAGVAREAIKIEHFNIAGEAPPVKSAAPKACPVDHSSTAAATPETPLDEARAFLRQHYSEAGAPAAFAPRWKQVEAEFLSSGAYRQTTDELTFAVRIAWRNAARCIGRLYWQGIAVRDFRHVVTASGMLDAIMDHIEVATNGGNLRPVITVFPQRGIDGSGPRVISSQLFRYAGYKTEDGTILGDPANIDLTDFAVGLGWTPPSPRTAFDLLPVIVQAAQGPPEWREIPAHLRLEIPIVHPDFPWFKDLGLRWYALPAVACMMLDAGGIQYTAVPFNGWYMGTEIGARNFSDVNRYNLLPVVARKMGLDTGDDRTLWKDRAIVELTLAVLHSYELAGVTMMDHHSASRAFNKFEEIENAEGRIVHGNWSWLVPPISGSTTTVFHMDHWRDIELKPRFAALPQSY
jgi:nitric-oxide synthase